MKIARLGAALLLTTALGACGGPNGYGNKEIVGTAAGAGIGGLIGSQFGHGTVFSLDLPVGKTPRAPDAILVPGVAD